MKKILIIIIGVALWVVVLTCKTEDKAIILPEEIGLAQEGDTLVVIKSTKETIVIGYKH